VNSTVQGPGVHGSPSSSSGHIVGCGRAQDDSGHVQGELWAASGPVAAQVGTVDPHLALVIKTKQRKIIQKKARNNVRVQVAVVSGTMNKYVALGCIKLT
jgi:hypothetical protein